MLTVWAVKIIGAICAFLPERFIRWVSWVVGSIFALIPTRRRYWVLSNLHHAFPERPTRWHYKMLRISMRRLVEMGLLSAASMYFRPNRIRKIISVSEKTRHFCLEEESKNDGGIILVPHFTLMESIPFLPFILKLSKPIGAFFRPFDNPHLNRLIKTTRERWGGKMLSRRDGFRGALETIRQGGWVTIFFDQNTGSRGVLVPFFGRVVSATNMPGLLATKFSTPVVMLYPKRIGFWRTELIVQKLDCSCDVKSITLASTKALESYLRSSDEQCADWLWAHNRWKIQVRPKQRLRLQHKKSFLEDYTESDSSKEKEPLQRCNRFWIRLPDHFDEVILVLPLIRALRKSRPDAAITLLSSSDWLDLLRPFHLAESYIRLPKKKRESFLFCWRLRKHFPDTFLLLKNTLRNDLEAWLTRAPQRFGMAFQKQKRALLTDVWKVSLKDILENNHRTLLWEKYWSYFGLAVPVIKKPLDCETKAIVPGKKAIIFLHLVQKSSWATALWPALLKKLIYWDETIHLYCLGGASSALYLSQLTENLPPEHCSNLTGKVPLNEWGPLLKNGQIILCMDSIGLYLANALGVPSMALFPYLGPKNKTPFFDTPVHFFSEITTMAPPSRIIESVLLEAIFDKMKQYL